MRYQCTLWCSRHNQAAFPTLFQPSMGFRAPCWAQLLTATLCSRKKKRSEKGLYARQNKSDRKQQVPITSDAVGAYGHIWESLLAGKLAENISVCQLRKHKHSLLQDQHRTISTTHSWRKMDLLGCFLDRKTIHTYTFKLHRTAIQ